MNVKFAIKFHGQSICYAMHMCALSQIQTWPTSFAVYDYFGLIREDHMELFSELDASITKPSNSKITVNTMHMMAIKKEICK